MMSEKLSPVSVAVALLTVCVTAAYNWRRRRKEQQHQNQNTEHADHRRSKSPTLESPEGVISTIIATALAHFLVIDAKTIESHVVTKSEIVLHNLQLRPQVTLLRNSVGHITGLIQEAVFTWKWGKWKDEAWIMGAALVIRGLKVSLELSPAEETFFDARSIPLLETIEEKAAAALPHVKEEIQTKGGLQVYIEKQVQLILDSLKLNVEGFDLTIRMPAAGMEHYHPAQRKTSIMIGGQSIELTSFRQQHDNGNHSNADDDRNLKLHFSIGSLYVYVIKDSENNTPSPVMEPFSYYVEATRTGRRFGSLATDIEGVGWCADGNGLVFHAGPVQIRALAQLGKLLQLPLPGDVRNSDIEETTSSLTLSRDEEGAPRSRDNTASVFEFNFPSVSVIWMDTIRVKVGEVIVSYRGGNL